MNVVELMNLRRKNRSKPLQRMDDFKLGLAIEGGGMRGVVSAGMLTALEHLGFTDVFDAVYGSSAGSINSAYFLARQSAYGTSIYYNDANCSQFISWWRLLTHRSPMQLDYLLYNVFCNIKVLDWQSALSSGIEFNILASSLDRGEAVSFRSFKSREDLLLALKASSCIPWFAGNPVHINNERFVDASFYEPIPYVSAIRNGCTHVLVLRTRPHGSRRESVSMFEKFVLKRYFLGRDSRHYDYYANIRSKRYNRDVASLEENVASVDGHEACVESIATKISSVRLSQLEKNKLKLLEGAMTGYNCALQFFGYDAVVPVDVITPFTANGRIFNN